MEVISAAVEESVEQHVLEKEMKEFEESKAGVKGLVDSGIVKIPKMFLDPTSNLQDKSCNNGGVQVQLPVIDFEGFESNRRSEIVEQIREAAETWGFFQMINHGIPIRVLDGVLESVRRFHEQPTEAKVELYSNVHKSVRYYSNEACEKSKCWRDTVSFQFVDDKVKDPEKYPSVCRLVVEEYMKSVIKLKDTLAELLSEALGLSSDYLSRIECMRSGNMLGHYYPNCPEPDLTQGMRPHSDLIFLTILLQDHIGGLQVLHQNRWVNLQRVQGSLIANVGDLMQLISNDKFKSVAHRVLASSAGPRVSAACFFLPSTTTISKPIGPIKELLSCESPIYKEVSFAEYRAFYLSNKDNYRETLDHFKL